MDREIPQQVLRKRRRRWISMVAVILVGLVLAAFFLRKTLASELDGNRLLTATAEIGQVESTITASGEVVPEYEEVITSSIQAEIREILVDIGTTVVPKTPILLLDKSFSLLEYEKLQQEFELKKNGMDKLRLDLKRKIFDLQIADSTKALQIQQLQASLDNAKRLLNIGGGTQEDIDLILTKLNIAKLEKKKLEFDLDIEQQQTKTSMRELELQTNIQGNSLKKMEKKLARANVLATRKGVVTWVNDNLGATVQEGEILARLADLNSFKIVGQCSGIYADRLNPGISTVVQLNAETAIEGKITNIRPTVENNILTFDVQIDEQDHPQLRPNMRVEVFIVVASKQNVVRVANGPVFKGQANQQLFVIQNDEAVRREVQVGLSNFDFVEIEQNIRPGEKIIISDMANYEHLSKIKIN